MNKQCAAAGRAMIGEKMIALANQKNDHRISPRKSCPRPGMRRDANAVKQVLIEMIIVISPLVVLVLP